MMSLDHALLLIAWASSLATFWILGRAAGKAAGRARVDQKLTELETLIAQVQDRSLKVEA